VEVALDVEAQQVTVDHHAGTPAEFTGRPLLDTRGEVDALEVAPVLYALP